MADQSNPEKYRGLKWAAKTVGASILGAIALIIFTPLGDVLQNWWDGVVSDPVVVDVDLDPVDWIAPETRAQISAYEADLPPKQVANLRAANMHLLRDTWDWSEGAPNWTPYYYYFGSTTKDELPPPPIDCRQRRPWAWDLGGADADETRMKLTLTGKRDSEISIDKMAVDVDSTPLGPGIVAACPVGGATGSTSGFLVDLERESVTYLESDQEAPARFILDKGRTESFDIYAVGYSQPRLYEWTLKLSVVDGGERRTITIDDDGRPFRTAGSAAAGSPMVVWRGGEWRWYRP